jgi:hypothetical protein
LGRVAKRYLHVHIEFPGGGIKKPVGKIEDQRPDNQRVRVLHGLRKTGTRQKHRHNDNDASNEQ